jgi:hypothetical protein
MEGNSFDPLRSLLRTSTCAASSVEAPHGHPSVGGILSLMANRDCSISMPNVVSASADRGCRVSRHGDGIAAPYRGGWAGPPSRIPVRDKRDQIGRVATSSRILPPESAAGDHAGDLGQRAIVEVGAYADFCVFDTNSAIERQVAEAVGLSSLDSPLEGASEIRTIGPQ